MVTVKWSQVLERQSQADDATKRARKLRSDVDNSSSHESRTWQTMGHLAGKAAGDASDAAIRHVENLKESEAEDQEERARRAGKDAGELGKQWNETFRKGK